MSNTRVVHSLGLPYFTMSSSGIPSQKFPDGGVISVNVTFVVHGLPPQQSADDEVHPIVAIGDLGTSYPPNPNVIELGVTPSGQFAMRTMYSDGLWTTTSLVLTNSATYQLDYLHDPAGIGSYLVVLETDSFYQNTKSYVFNGAIEEPSSLAPVHVGVPMFFNGTDSFGRLPVSLMAASMYFWDGITYSVCGVSWAFDEEIGGKVAAKLITDEGYSTAWWERYGITAEDFDLSAKFFDPSPYYAKLYGDVPDQSRINEAFDWDIFTRYVKRVDMPTTGFSKMTFPTTAFSMRQMPTTTYVKAVSRA